MNGIDPSHRPYPSPFWITPANRIDASSLDVERERATKAAP
jgi:hypothetical protein